MPTKVQVDFNSRGPGGTVPAPVEDAGAPLVVGEVVDLWDEDGNRCIAYVVGVKDGWLTLAPEWETFAAPGASRLLLAPATSNWVARLRGRLTVSLTGAIAPFQSPRINTDQHLIPAKP